MAKNKDGIEKGALVTFAEMVAANACRGSKPSKKDERADLIETLVANGLDAPTGSLQDLRDMVKSVTKVSI